MSSPRISSSISKLSENNYCLAKCKTALCPSLARYIGNTMIVFFISSLSGETVNSVGMARLAEPVRCISGRSLISKVRH